jgi:uncharacterized membrane protein
MEAEFRGYDFERGILLGIAAVTEHLARHFPASGARRNELPDEPVVM